PTLRESEERLPRKLRRGLADGGRWLDADKRARLQAWLDERPQMATLAAYRQRLQQGLDERSHDAHETLARLHAWCEEAEQSGIKALQQISARLKGYTLVQAAHCGFRDPLARAGDPSPGDRVQPGRGGAGACTVLPGASERTGPRQRRLPGADGHRWRRP